LKFHEGKPTYPDKPVPVVVQYPSEQGLRENPTLQPMYLKSMTCATHASKWTPDPTNAAYWTNRFYANKAAEYDSKGMDGYENSQVQEMNLSKVRFVVGVHGKTTGEVYIWCGKDSAKWFCETDPVNSVGKAEEVRKYDTYEDAQKQLTERLPSMKDQYDLFVRAVFA
jgi:hypothetical protein